MPHQYTAAVIGAGMGGKASMTALSASPRFHLAAVADFQAEARAAAQEQYPGIRTFPNHAENVRGLSDRHCLRLHLAALSIWR